MRIKSGLLVFILSLVFDLAFGQGDANLLLQYRKGPDMSRYRKWNFDLHLRGVYMSPQGNHAVPKIGYAFGGNIQYKYANSFGATTGVDLLSVHYQYQLNDNTTTDQIRYLSFPLAIRVFPTARTHFETGLLYHHLLKAENSAIVDLRQNTNTYPEGVFKNAFGWLFGVHYNIWKKFYLSLEYRFFKRATITQRIQKNNFNGFLVGVHFLIRSPNRKGP
jgi:opacity protein-like surface antigen|tara:strand:- start:261 stop:917 length:657 start_codon:yes stop_codon:yes gene_type:complete